MNDIYQQFRKESLHQLTTLQPESVKVFHFEPIEGYTLVARPNKEFKEVYSKLVNSLKEIESDHYYYPFSDLHLTIIGEISFTKKAETVIEAVKKILPKYQLQFDLFGLASVSASSISAYPINFSIHELREELRSEVQDEGTDYKIFIPLYEHMGWINYLRYFHTPSQQFLDKMYEYKDTHFGIMKPTRIELYKTTSRVLDPQKSELL